MLPIKGIQKTTLVDFEPYVSSTIFIGGCNWRCGFCHNRNLVVEPDKVDTIDEEDVLNFLKERKGLIDGVCITGGEPTIHAGLPDFVRKVKELGLKVKLDTNGSNPEMVGDLINEKLIDYVALDIKSAKEDYDKAAGAEVDMAKIEDSIKTIRESGIDYEFRTTVFPGLDERSMKDIGEWLKGGRKFVLQQFENDVPIIDESLKNRKPLQPEKLREFSKILKPYFEEVNIKGI